MLNTISDVVSQSALMQMAEFAAPVSATETTGSVIRPRPRPELGTLLSGGAPVIAPATPRTFATTRPCATAAAAVVSTVAHAAPATSGQDAALRLSGKQFAYMTRIGALGAGAPGSHPAREPV
jgi:hypothetical protein